jgi:hypothetical protein
MKKTKPEGDNQPESESTAEMVQGNIVIRLMPPVNPAKLRAFEAQLTQTGKLSLVMVGGAAEGNVEINVLAVEPEPVADILRELPVVSEVSSKGKHFQITLEPEAAAKAD